MPRTGIDSGGAVGDDPAAMLDAVENELAAAASWRSPAGLAGVVAARCARSLRAGIATSARIAATASRYRGLAAVVLG